MKSKRRKLLCLLISILTCVSLLSGCGSVPSPSETAAETDVSGETAKDLNETSVPEPPSSTEETLEALSLSDPGEMTVHFLDVGQGLSILVRSGGETMIYDGGDRNASRFTVSYLQNLGITDIKYMISSHYDEDHVAGLVGCLNAFSVERVIGPDYEQDTKIYQSFISSAAAKGLTVEHPAVGTEYAIGSGTFTILAPESISDNDNDNSVAIKLQNGENTFIFTGDAEHTSEEAMCTSGIDLSCDVLCAGHHGSATATTYDFLQKTLPDCVVISCGEGNSYGHPHEETMEKLESMGAMVFRTDKQGTLIATSDGTGITWNVTPSNDYSSGDSMKTQEADSSAFSAAPETTPEIAESFAPPTPVPETSTENQAEMVWIPATGKKYHNKPDCGNMNPDRASRLSRPEAENRGYSPCKKCY